MKHVAWDYEDTYYLIYALSPILEDSFVDEVIEFDALQTPENDFAVQQIVDAFDRMGDKLLNK